MPEPIDIKTGEPKQRAPKQDTKPRAPRVGERQEDGTKKRGTADLKLKTELASTYTMLGMGIAGIGINREDRGIAGTGAAVVTHAEAAAEAWLDLADKNPKVKAALMRLTEASAVGALVSIHVAIAMPLLADRGMVPEAIATAMGVKLAADAAQNNGSTA